MDKRRPFEIINLGSHRPITVSTVVAAFEQLLGKKTTIKHQGLPAGDVPVTFANIDKAKKLLGWQPKTGLEEGVEKLVNWYMILRSNARIIL